MTAGYDASKPDEESGATSERLGPLPPRINPTGSFPAVPVASPAFPPGPPGSAPPGYAARPMSPPLSAVPGGFPAGPVTGPPTGHLTGGLPARHAPGPPFAGPHNPPQQFAGPHPVSPQSASPYVTSGAPFGGAPQHGRAPRGGALGRAAFILVILLLVVVAGQSVLIYQLNHKVDTTRTALAKQRDADNARLDGLEARAKSLEQKTGSSLNTSDVAAAVLPSVFRVETPQALGTAFAIGKAPAGGGTNLLTNNHVVTEYYAQGGRDVALTRDNLRFTAKIVKVDPAKDLALLHTDESFPRLLAQTTPPAAGDPVLVIGAPLGLPDSVTSGVVSAFRDTPDGQRIQFDAPINPGNSGGPVVNANKAVVGIATAKAQAAEGIGLAIPIKVACDAFSVC